MVDKEFIRKRIAAIRFEKGISARKLSLDLGYSSEACNQIERGNANATIDFILALCEYFQISLAQFFDDTIEHPTELAPIINDLKKLKSEDLKQIATLVKRLGDKK